MCCAIWCVGLCVYAYRGFPKFEPLAMLGGALWCAGNAMAVPIINMLGLALGMSVWCVANMATGWASGVFGILGLEKQPVPSPVLNYIGAAVAASSIVLFTLVRNSPASQSDSANSSSGSASASEHRSLIDEYGIDYDVDELLGSVQQRRGDADERVLRKSQQQSSRRCPRCLQFLTVSVYNVGLECVPWKEQCTSCGWERRFRFPT